MSKWAHMGLVRLKAFYLVTTIQLQTPLGLDTLPVSFGRQPFLFWLSDSFFSVLKLYRKKNWLNGGTALLGVKQTKFSHDGVIYRLVNKNSVLKIGTPKIKKSPQLLRVCSDHVFLSTQASWGVFLLPCRYRLFFFLAPKEEEKLTRQTTTQKGTKK